MAEIVGRVLPVEDWSRLDASDSPLKTLYASLDPEQTLIVVVEEDGVIVSSWAAMTTIHVEGLWQTPAVRTHIAHARALLETMTRELLARGVKEVLTHADSPAVERMIETAGGRQVPGTAWVIPLS